MLPTGGTRPASASRSMYSIDTYWALSSGRRNTLTKEFAMNNRHRRSMDLGEGREEQGRFWLGIAAGMSSEDSAVVGGVSQPVGIRWFRTSASAMVQGMEPGTDRASELTPDFPHGNA